MILSNTPLKKRVTTPALANKRANVVLCTSRSTPAQQCTRPADFCNPVLLGNGLGLLVSGDLGFGAHALSQLGQERVTLEDGYRDTFQGAFCQPHETSDHGDVADRQLRSCSKRAQIRGGVSAGGGGGGAA